MRHKDFVSKVSSFEYKLYRIAYRLLEHKPDAEDAVQEVLMKLWLNRDRLNELKSIEAFAVRMIKNCCFDQLSKTREVIHSSDGLLFVQAPEITDSGLEKEDYEQVMEAIISNLPIKEKLMLQLRNIEAYGIDEIANIMEMEPNNVRVILSRVRKKVRKAYLNWKNYEG